MKSNPYARKPQNTDRYEKTITQYMDLTKCQFTGEVHEVYKTMLNQNTPSFMRGELDVGYNDDFPLEITLKEGTKPIYQRPFRLPPHLEEEAQKQLNELRDQGIIIPYFGAFNSPAFLVKKETNKSHSHLYKDDNDRNIKWCMVDLKLLNSLLVLRNLPVCTLADNLDVLGNSIQQMKKECPVIFFSSFDLRAGFYQLSVSSNSFKYLGYTLGT